MIDAGYGALRLHSMGPKFDKRDLEVLKSKTFTPVLGGSPIIAIIKNIHLYVCWCRYLLVLLFPFAMCLCAAYDGDLSLCTTQQADHVGRAVRDAVNPKHDHDPG